MKRVLVTGANKGIGLAIVRAALEEHEDTFVYLGSRNESRGQQARQSLVDEHPHWADRVEVLSLDVASDESVAAAAQRIAQANDEATPLYGIVNNAGIGFGVSELRNVLEVNTYGLERVCEKLLPLIDPEGGRVVNVTSAAGPNFVAACSEARQKFFVDAQVTRQGVASLLEECLGMEGESAFEAAGLGKGEPYGLSKASSNALTVAFARENPKLRINACTPGFIATDLTRPYADSQGKTTEELGMKPPSAGARSAMFLLFGEPEGNGRYYGSDAVRSPMDRYRSPGAPPYEGD